jgi:hypothetical protein
MLNALQKQILDATFYYIFSTLSEDSSPDVGLKALEAIKEVSAYQAYKELLSSNDLLVQVDQIKAIYNHKCPQNRSTGSPYVIQQPGLVTWEPYGHDLGTVSEEQGLLGLTAQNDSTTPHVTKTDVTQYLDSFLETCRKELKDRLVSPTSVSQAASSTIIPVEVLFAFVQAVVGFHEAFKHEIVNYQGLEPSAAANYMTSVLNAIRKNAWKDFLKDPEGFAVPKEMKNFVVDYLKEHPVLLEAKTFEKYTKELEKQYSVQYDIDILNSLPEISMPQAATPFWAVPVISTPISFTKFAHAACDLTEKLTQTLSQFRHLDPKAANTYVSNLLTAIRKNQVEDFFEDPELFGVPAELKDLLGKELQCFPILLQDQSLDAQAIKTVEVAIARNSIAQIRQSLASVNNGCINNNNNNNNNNDNNMLRLT